MNFVHGVPDIKIKKNETIVKITTVEYFKETEKQIILKFSEYVPELKKGSTYDMELILYIVNEYEEYQANAYAYVDINDIYLVYINREHKGLEVTWEYIFHK